MMLLSTFSFLSSISTAAVYSETDRQCENTKDPGDKEPPSPWWKSAVIYEVYLRSFKDSNGDGVGDIKGLISKLDYLKSLGVNLIWITPHYDFPNTDNGYDIRNYNKVLKQFGTMKDFEALISALNQRDMRLMIDLVYNHTSSEHIWFKKSRASLHNPYRDFYFWCSPHQGKEPNNYPSYFGSSAWEFDPKTQQY